MKNNKKKLIIMPILSLATSLMLTVLSSAADIGAGIVNVSWGNLNVRSSPSVSSNIVARLQNKSYVTILSKNGDWLHVEYADGTFGYCHADYISPISYDSASVKTSGGNLNVRSSAAGYIKDKVANGDDVVILSSSGGWYRVLYDGNDTGWVSASYISRDTQSSDNVKYPKISLPISRYSQADSRWGGITIGSYGESIAKIGCTVSCFAMSETYRTGNTVTPATVAKNQSFTAGGALYWPSNYTRTSTSSYLSFLYEKLSEGIPVLIEAKKSSGAKHWVLVTGYTGGDTLSASSFTINDPSLQNRKTLAELFSDYPLYSKMAYYLY